MQVQKYTNEPSHLRGYWTKVHQIRPNISCTRFEVYCIASDMDVIISSAVACIYFDYQKHA